MFVLKNIEELNNSGISGQLLIETEIPNSQSWEFGKYCYIKDYEKYIEFYNSILHEPILINAMRLRSLNYNSVNIDIQTIKKDSFGQKEINVLEVDVYEQSKTLFTGELIERISISNKENLQLPLNGNLSITFDYEQLNRASEFDKIAHKKLILRKSKRKVKTWTEWIKEILQF